MCARYWVTEQFENLRHLRTRPKFWGLLSHFVELVVYMTTLGIEQLTLGVWYARQYHFTAKCMR